MSELGIRETIVDLRRDAEIYAKEHPEVPEEAQYLNARADELEWELDQYYEIRARVLVLANQHKEQKEAELLGLRRLRGSKEPLTGEDLDRLQYTNLNKVIDDPAAMLETSRHADLRQRLDVWIRELQTRGLLTPADVRACNPIIPPSPAALERRRAEQQEIDRLVKLREKIMSTIAPGWDRQEALTEWNAIGGYVDANKVNQWIERCRTKGLLGIEFLPARRLGALVQRILYGKEEVSNVHFK